VSEVEWGTDAQCFDRAIRPGVVLFLGCADACADRVQLSAGTIAAPVGRPGLSYKEAARIPRLGWRSLTMADRKALIAESCPELYGNAISVVGIPSRLLYPFRALRAAATECQSMEKLLAIIGSDAASEGIHAISGYLQNCFQPFRIDADCVPQGGILPRPPGLHTVSVDTDTHAFLGLHVDNCYSFTLDRREFSPNRVCVNLGSEARFFLFVNISLGQMCEVMDDDQSGEKMFMRTFPSYPVVRVRIRPGEAYIAPTENIVHDGSSIDMNTMDVTLSLRGRFNLCAKQLGEDLSNTERGQP
jgi:hypothetical protein